MKKQMETIEFLEDGVWSDDPSKPIFKVKAGDVVLVSSNMAKFAIENGKAKLRSNTQEPQAPLPPPVPREPPVPPMPQKHKKKNK